MKSTIILAIATLSTGIVLSATLHSSKADVKPIVVKIEKSTFKADNGADRSVDAVSTAD